MNGMNGNELALGILIMGFFFLRPIARAWARRLDSGADVHVLRDELARLDDRVAQLEAENARLLEVEERLDFAERLLAGSRQTDASPASPVTDGAR